MTFTLHVDGARWRRHTETTRNFVREAISAGVHHHSAGDLVPVAKGNGYGLGNARLAREVTRLGLTRLAVGTVFEATDLAETYEGDILVLTPFEPADSLAAAAWMVLAQGPHNSSVLPLQSISFDRFEVPPHECFAAISRQNYPDYRRCRRDRQ